MRSGKIKRKTTETDISVYLKLDGTGKYKVQTGIGFFDHMLEQLARHSLIDLEVKANGDTHIDDHHTVEDTGIALGQALTEAIGNKEGINRYGWCLLPMDDTLVRTALDLSARPFLYFDVDMPTDKIGSFDTELVREFFQAEDGIRDRLRSRGLGDVYKRQVTTTDPKLFDADIFSNALRAE